MSDSGERRNKPKSKESMWSLKTNKKSKKILSENPLD